MVEAIKELQQRGLSWVLLLLFWSERVDIYFSSTWKSFVRARTSSEAQFSTSEKHSIQCIITLASSFLNVFWKRSEDNWTSVSPRSRNAKNTGKLSYNSVGHITVPEIRGNFFRSLVLSFKLFRFTLTWLGGTWVTFLQEWLSKSSTFLCVFNVSCDPRYRVPYLS